MAASLNLAECAAEQTHSSDAPQAASHRLSHLDLLEAESIHIFREVAAEF